MLMQRVLHPRVVGRETDMSEEPIQHPRMVVERTVETPEREGRDIDMPVEPNRKLAKVVEAELGTPKRNGQRGRGAVDEKSPEAPSRLCRIRRRIMLEIDLHSELPPPNNADADCPYPDPWYVRSGSSRSSSPSDRYAPRTKRIGTKANAKSTLYKQGKIGCVSASLASIQARADWEKMVLDKMDCKVLCINKSCVSGKASTSTALPATKRLMSL